MVYDFFLGITTLPPEVMRGFPVQWTLWETSALLCMTSFCPLRIPRQWGTNWQHGWSMETSGLNFSRLGWIGSLALAPFSGVSQTRTQRTPLFFGLTTHSSLKRGPLDRQW